MKNPVFKIYMTCWLVWVPILAISQTPDYEIREVTAPETSHFYDSLKTKAYRSGLTRFIYKNLIKEIKEKPEDLQKQYEYLKGFNGKTIVSLEVQSLEVFGPSFTDPTRRSDSRLARWSNRLHTKTNLNIIRKNVLLKVGDVFDVDKMLENERIIRILPYIKDVRFIILQNSQNENQVHVLVLTKDVFSFGFSGRFNGPESAELEMYNQNIWGIGHQISGRMVGHVEKEPYIGFEGFYTINNIGGNFIDLSLGYANTYKREGVGFFVDKQFLRTSTRFGGGLYISRLKRSDRLFEENDPIRVEDDSLDYRYFDMWAGYAFQLKKNTPDQMQLVFSSRMRKYDFFKRPVPDPQNNQYFANSDLYFASLSLSKRSFIRDHLVYGYGITEDIPRGFLHEWVVGFDDNEFTNRWYTHFYFSSGNFIRYKPSYLQASFGIGGFFNSMRYEQGQAEVNANYISRLFRVGNQRARQFIKLNYVLGIRRFELEDLYLRYRDGIRGFYSNAANGKQRLNLKLETVLFQNKEFLRFNVSFYGFADLGIIGSNNKIIFNQNYYAGIGGGIRLKNESLVFRTLQLRLAYYPNHPADIGGFGIEFTERSKTNFMSFQPRRPETLRFD